MNKAAQQLGRLGGKARSEAKTNANRINAQRYWDAVRAGTAKGPRRGKKPSGLHEGMEGCTSI